MHLRDCMPRQKVTPIARGGKVTLGTGAASAESALRTTFATIASFIPSLISGLGNNLIPLERWSWLFNFHWKHQKKYHLISNETSTSESKLLKQAFSPSSRSDRRDLFVGLIPPMSWMGRRCCRKCRRIHFITNEWDGVCTLVYIWIRTAAGLKSMGSFCYSGGSE